MTLAGLWSRASVTTGTIEYRYTHFDSYTLLSFPLYGHVVVTHRAISVQHRFHGQLLVTPGGGFNPTIGLLWLELRGWLRTVVGCPDGCDQNPEFVYLHQDHTFVNNA